MKKLIAAVLFWLLPALAFGAAQPVPTGLVYMNWLSGLVLSNDATNPQITLDVEAGQAADSTNQVLINIGAFNKGTQGAWAAGSGQNGMGNGLTIAASTGYDVCLAYNGGTPDIWFDTSATCANKPTGISGALYRRIGSIVTDSSAHILGFVQHGDTVLWNAVQDGGSTSVGTSPVSLQITTPLGVPTEAIVTVGPFTATANTNYFFYSPGQTATNQNVIKVQVASQITYGTLRIFTDTNRTIMMESNGTGGTVTEFTDGYVDTRGKTN